MVHCSHRGICISAFEHSLNSRILYVRGMRVPQLLGGKLQLGGPKASCSGYSAEMSQNWEWSGSPAASRGSAVSSPLLIWHSYQPVLLQESQEFVTRLIQPHFSACLTVKQQGLLYINIFSEIWYYSLLPIRFSTSIFSQLFFHSVEKPDVFSS